MLGQPIQTRLASFKEVPIIDISGAGDPARRRDLVRQITRACEEVGFMYIVGHGISERMLDDVFDMSRAFFALPIEKKRAIDLKKSPFYRGYLGIGEKGNDPTHKGNLVEAFQCHEDLAPDHADVRAGMPLRGPNLWPDEPVGFRNVVYTYYQETYRLGLRLLELFAEGLDQPSDFFTRHYRHSLAQLRLLHYPAQESPREGGQIGARAHCDTGVITILTQDSVGGLEVLNKSGEWIAVPPIKYAYVINIGNTLQFWTGGRFSSTTHRVGNRYGGSRFSIPFFMTPDYDTVVRPIGMETDPNAPTFHVGEEILSTYRRIWPSMAA